MAIQHIKERIIVIAGLSGVNNEPLIINIMRKKNTFIGRFTSARMIEFLYN